MSLIRIDMGPEEAVDQMNAFFEVISQILGYKLKIAGGELVVEGEQGTVVLASRAYVDEHEGKTSTHGATAAATPNRIMMRNANGRAKVAAPVEADDIARKAEVDAVAQEVENRTKIATGQYAGNDASNRHINVGFAPKYVKIKCLIYVSADNTAKEIEGEMFANGLCFVTSKHFRTPVNDTVIFSSRLALPSIDWITQNGFYVSTGAHKTLNQKNENYSWVAFG